MNADVWNLPGTRSIGPEHFSLHLAEAVMVQREAAWLHSSSPAISAETTRCSVL